MTRLSMVYPIIFLALVLPAALQVLASSEDEANHHYFYYKEKINLIEDTNSVAIYSDFPGSTERLVELFAEADYPNPDVRAHPSPGWSIALLGSASGTPRVLGVSQIISKLIEVARSHRYFFSPVFAGKDGKPILITPNILVRFQRGVREPEIRRVLATAGAGGAEKESFGGMENCFRIKMRSRSGFEVLAAANALAQSPNVVFAEPSMVLNGRTSAIPNDPLFGDSWGLHNTGPRSIGYNLWKSIDRRGHH